MGGIQNNLNIRDSSLSSRPHSSSGNFYGLEIRHGLFFCVLIFAPIRSSSSLEIRSTRPPPPPRSPPPPPPPPPPLRNPVSSRSFRFYRVFSNSLKWFAILASFPGTELLLMNAFTLYTDSKEIISNKPKSNCSDCCCIPLMSQRLNHHSLVLKQRKVWVTSP